MLHRLYARVLALSASKRAPFWLALVAFAESSIFPVPPDALLIPMSLARPERAFRFAAICTAASVAGGALGYLIGYALFNQLGQGIIEHVCRCEQAFLNFQTGFAKYGLWIILIKGLTPIPYKLVTIASGAAAFSFPAFIAASVVTRGARFFLEAALLQRFGAPVADSVERRLTLVTSAAAFALVAGFLAIKYL